MLKDYSKQFRKLLGFRKANECQIFLKGADLTKNLDNINWKLVNAFNQRIITICQRSQNNLIVPNQEFDVESFVNQSFSIVQKYGLILKLGNQGRAYEKVYFDWMLGRVVEALFTPLIKEKMKLDSMIRIGGDNLDNLHDPKDFKRISAPDFYDATKNISVDVQCGKTNADTTIKKSKVDHVLEKRYNGYVFAIGLFTGLYAIINLNDLKDAEYTKDGKEGQLTTKVENIVFEPWSKN